MKQMQTMGKNAANSSDPKLLKDCLTGASLGNLVVRAQHILSIHKLLQAELPSMLAPHCQVLNIENGTLVLAGDSAAFVTRLRYLTPEIIDTLNSNDAIPTVNHVICKVIPQTKKNGVSEKPPLSLSSSTRQLLEQTAGNIKHPQLKKSLTTMAK